LERFWPVLISANGLEVENTIDNYRVSFLFVFGGVTRSASDLRRP